MNKAVFTKLKPAIENIVENKILEMLGDPDQGLELKPEVKNRLKQSVSNRKRVPAVKVAGELGLQW